MKIELTEQEAAFLLDVLDKISVSGIVAKELVIRLMLKLAPKTEDTP